MCALLILHPSPYPFPGRLREECLAEGYPQDEAGLGAHSRVEDWGRSQVHGQGHSADLPLGVDRLSKGLAGPP